MQLKKLMDAAYNNDQDICGIVEAMVPTYHPDLGGVSDKDKTYEKLCREATGVS